MSGCINNSEGKPDTKNDVIDYMRNKYNEEFDFLTMNTEVWTANHTEMLLSSKSFPGHTIIVHQDRKTGEITDNYLAIKLNAEIEKKVSEIVKEIYGESKTFSYPKSLPLPSSLLPNSTAEAEDYLRAKPQITDITIIVTRDINTKEIDLEMFRAVLKEKGYYLTFSIVYVDKPVFDVINETNYIDYTDETRNDVLAYGEFIVGESHDFSYKKWRK